MSVVCVLAPVVIAAWPAFSAAVAGAAASLGYAVIDGREKEEIEAASQPRISLDIPRSEVVTGSLGREKSITVRRGNAIVTFSRDARGAASLCVAGDGLSDEELRACGEELAQGVVQQYIYQRLKNEMQNRQFMIVEEEESADRSIRIKVRHWQD